MNFRKNSVLIIGCGAALLLLAAAVVFLVRYQGAYTENLRSLSASKARLNALNTRDPFPSADNVVLAQQNLDFLKQKYDIVHGDILKEQFVLERVEPARFAPMLEDSARQVYRRAEEAGVKVASDMGLGFKDYAAGKLPPADPVIMERLVLQLKAVEDVCLTLIESKIQSIDRIERDTFERSQEAPTADATTGRGRGRPVPGRPQAAAQAMVLGLPAPATNVLYRTERFLIEFTGWESTVWDVLNKLISRPVTYVLSDVSFENTNTGIGKPVDMKAKLGELNAALRQGQSGAGIATATEATLASIPHEDRIVGGREPIKVRMVVDMYLFTNDVDGQGEEQP